MADNKKGFVLYADLIHTINKMPSEKAGDLFKHILSYVNDENPTTDDMLIDLVFEPIKQQLKRDLRKYEDKKLQWSEAGKRSAEVRKAKKNERTLTNVESRSTDSTVIVKDTVTVKDKVIDIKEKKPKTVFVPPSKKEFMVFARSKFKTEELYQASRDKLLLKYDAWSEAKWINGRTEKKIKNWKVTLLNTIPHL